MWYNDYIGIPFIDRGRTRQGFDCWGLVKAVFSDVKGIDLPSYDSVYEDVEKDCKDISNAIVDQSKNHWKPVSFEETREFDVIIMRMRGLPMHVGLVTKPFHMLHCIEGSGTVHECFDSAKWKHRIIGFVRHANG